MQTSLVEVNTTNCMTTSRVVIIKCWQVKHWGLHWSYVVHHHFIILLVRIGGAVHFCLMCR